jgi:DNA-directed RNA polymerase specialized sigma24 family protein
MNLARQEMAAMPQSWMSSTPLASALRFKSILADSSAPDDDTRLLKQCRRGNKQAWNLLVDRYQKLIYSVPAKLGLSADQCADVFYAVCIELLNVIDRLPRRVMLRDWLLDAAARHSWNRRHGPSERSDSLTLSAELKQELKMEQAFREALAAMPASGQEMLRLLSIGGGKTAAEIAQEVAKTFPEFDVVRSLEDFCRKFEELR